jgi:hypothetical protein
MPVRQLEGLSIRRIKSIGLKKMGCCLSGILSTIERTGILASLNFSQFVEGWSWGPWAREGLEEAYVFAGDPPCTGEEIYRPSARFYALQTLTN